MKHIIAAVGELDRFAAFVDHGAVVEIDIREHREDIVRAGERFLRHRHAGAPLRWRACARGGGLRPQCGSGSGRSAPRPPSQAAYLREWSISPDRETRKPPARKHRAASRGRSCPDTSRCRCPRPCAGAHRCRPARPAARCCCRRKARHTARPRSCASLPACAGKSATSACAARIVRLPKLLGGVDVRRASISAMLRSDLCVFMPVCPFRSSGLARILFAPSYRAIHRQQRAARHCSTPLCRRAVVRYERVFSCI